MAWTPRIRHHVRAAFAALPLESSAIAVAVVAIWCQVASPQNEMVGRVLFAAILAVPLLFAATLLRRSRRILARPALVLAGAGAVAATAIAMSGADLDEAYAWRFGLSLLAATMLPFVAVAAGSPRGERLVRFADFVRRFTEETTSSALLGGLAIAAAAVLVMSVQTLFRLRLERFGMDLGALIAGLCAIAYLGRLVASGAPGRVPEVWRRLIARVAAPFLVAMLAILAVYELWVLALGELPVNLVSPLIIAAGAIGFASTLVIESLVAVREERVLSPADPHPWTAAASVRVSRGFTAVLLALLPLAAWALWVRIDQHGLTPPRAGRMYALGCLGLLALWGTLRWTRRRRPLTWEVPAMTAAAAIIAAVGPLSVVSLSIRSQSARLERGLDQAGVSERLVRAEQPDETVAIDEAAFDELAGRIGELVDIGGLPALAEVLDGDLSACRWRWDGASCLHHLGVRSVGSPPPEQRASVYLAAPSGPHAAGYQVIDLDLSSTGHPADIGTLTLSASADELVVSRDGARWVSTRLGPLGAWMKSGQLGELPPLIDAQGCESAYAVARSAVIEQARSGPVFTRLELLLLVPPVPRCP